MPDALRWILAALLGYLLGSVNISILISRLVMKDDIRRHGSGNAGATNVLRLYGKGWTVVVSLFDLGKGIAAVLIGQALLAPVDSAMTGRMLGGMAVIVGHAFPLFFGFRGGKGVLTSCGVLFMLDWRVAAIALGLFFVVVICTRYISLGALVAFVTYTIASIFFGHARQEVLVFAALTVLVFYLHRENIGRLRRGEERKIGEKKPS